MPHILFLMSDTGGGHRAACRAIEAALNVRHPGEFTVELVDVWKDYTPFPFNTSPNSYSRWVNTNPDTYSATFWLTDRLALNPKFSRFYCAVMLPQMKRLYEDHPADIIVCVHSVFVRPTIHALRKLKIDKPFVTVITDYAWPTTLWYDPRVDRCLVPTEPAYERGLSLGMQAAQMALTGAPVHPKFTHVTMTKTEARKQLGWDPKARIVLLVGGGDGMGPVVATARALDARKVDCHVVIIAGRNQNLKELLNSMAWEHPVYIYGFVDNMQILMRAADLLITKAGPATITEAALLGLPMVISGAIQHQESPNVDYVLKHHAGVYAPGPMRVAHSVEQIFTNGGTELNQLAEGARNIAQPEAIWNIADEIWRYA